MVLHYVLESLDDKNSVYFLKGWFVLDNLLLNYSFVSSRVRGRKSEDFLDFFSGKLGDLGAHTITGDAKSKSSLFSREATRLGCGYFRHSVQQDIGQSLEAQDLVRAPTSSSPSWPV